MHVYIYIYTHKQGCIFFHGSRSPNSKDFEPKEKKNTNTRMMKYMYKHLIKGYRL